MSDDRVELEPVDPPVGTSPDPSSGHGPARRRLGFSAAELDGLVDLPDDVEAMGEAITADGRPFNGAFVPVVLHDPMAAERSYDAAEWAADLIATAGGQYLAVAACTPGPDAETASGQTGAGAGSPDADESTEPVLNPRQWNHAAAMMERLEGVGRRFGLRILARDTLGEVDVRDDEAIDETRPIHHLLDTGRYLLDGHVPARLVCPESDALDAGGERSWDPGA